MPRGQAEALVPMIGDLLAAALPGGAPAAIVVDVGPGSFTGLRVALAAGHALAVAWDVPIHGVTALAMLALAALRPGERALVVLDARRSQFYGQMFDWTAGAPAPLPAAAPRVDAAAALIAHARENGASCIIGPAAGQLAHAAAPALACRSLPLLPASRLADCLSFPALHGEARPLYVRAPDAKLPAAPTLLADA